jgi:hypothetical protein
MIKLKTNKTSIKGPRQKKIEIKIIRIEVEKPTIKRVKL